MCKGHLDGDLQGRCHFSFFSFLLRFLSFFKFHQARLISSFSSWPLLLSSVITYTRTSRWRHIETIQILAHFLCWFRSRFCYGFHFCFVFIARYRRMTIFSFADSEKFHPLENTRNQKAIRFEASSSCNIVVLSLNAFFSLSFCFHRAIHRTSTRRRYIIFAKQKKNKKK